jgi:hypothetical protein
MGRQDNGCPTAAPFCCAELQSDFTACLPPPFQQMGRSLEAAASVTPLFPGFFLISAVARANERP